MISKEVPFHRIEHTQNLIIIKKKRTLWERQVFFSILIVALIVLTFWSLLIKSPYAFNKELSIQSIILLIFVGVMIAGYIYLRFKRFLRVIKNYTLEKKNGLIINKRPAFHKNIQGEIAVVIQDVSGWKGVGSSFTVGLSKGKKFLGLCYGLKRRDAQEVAEFIAQFLEYNITYKEAVLFPSLKLH